MSNAAPVAIGTRGTVGSLVRKEIEYFRRMELGTEETSKSKPNHVGVSSTSTSYSNSRVKTATLSSLLKVSWRKKRRNSISSRHNSNSFLPSMCAAVHVSESKRFGGFSYRNLKDDVNIR